MERTTVEKEIHRRIMVSIYAYAYEFENESLVSDDMFDMLCYQIDPFVDTGRPKLDDFFANVFRPHTGQWIHKHPELDKIKRIYFKYYDI